MIKSNYFQRDESIVEYAPLVDKLAKRIISRLPSNVELDDLKSAGFIGLIDAIEKFSDEKGTPFSVYAEIRIRGAIMDELRSRDWVPRSVRDRNQKLQEAIQTLQLKLGRKPSESELAESLNCTLAELHQYQNRAEIKSLLSLEDLGQRRDSDGGSRDVLEMIADPEQDTPEDHIERVDEAAMLQLALSRLRPRQNTILRLYYFEDMKLREIGEHLNITESRVSQILSESLGRLKVVMHKLQRGDYIHESK